jgi:hypothetical protein
MSKSTLPRYGLNSAACPGLGLINNIYTLKEMTIVLTSRPCTMIYEHHSGIVNPLDRNGAILKTWFGFWRREFFARPTVSKNVSRGVVKVLAQVVPV